MHEPEKGSIMK